MNKFLIIFSTLFFLSGCLEDSNKNAQTLKAKEAADSIVFSENAEIENIKNRLKLTSNPGQIGYILLLNYAGQPILYTTIKGKVTSSSKRLTPPDRYSSLGPNGFIRAGASDEGTYGNSDSYVYFWDQNGRYFQWSGQYLYSDQPIRVTIEPLVVNVKAAN